MPTTSVAYRGGFMELSQILQKRSFRVLIPALMALIFYSQWASFINRETSHQALSSSIEGLRAFIFTILGNLVTEFMWSATARVEKLSQRVPLACLMTWCFMQSIAFSVHFSINPATALATIAPSLIISAIYVSFYMSGLAKIHSAQATHPTP